jgi:signal transduction histidine kinase
MRYYDFMLDSLVSSEQNDSLTKIEQEYNRKSSSRINSISNLEKEILDITSQKKLQEEQYSSLIRKSLISFLVWLGIVLLLLQITKRKLKKATENLDSTTNQLQILESYNSKAALLFNDIKTRLPKLESAKTELSRIKESLAEKAGQSTEISGQLVKADQLLLSVHSEKFILDSIISQSDDSENEPELTDMNTFCNQYLEIVTKGFLKEGEFSCTVTHDFEKNLPPISIHRAAVGSMLINVLINAFQSVQEKSSKEIKGYEPKVAISTRILPRFLQIRVKDNGLGMTDEVLSKVHEEFYSTRKDGIGAGLGLYLASEVVGVMHKGEIKIETEKGNSTDVYIKFFK